MIDLGLSPAERHAFERSLGSSHQVRVQVVIRNAQEDPISALTADSRDIYGGSVDMDRSASVTRQLELIIADPERILRWEPGSPGRRSFFADRFVSVEWGIFSTELNRWVDTPVFWGPITNFERRGQEVTIEGMGKEILMMDPHLMWHPLKLKKGDNTADAIKKILREKGERRFDFPNVNERLHRDIDVKKDDEPWLVAQRLARSLNRQLFYDGKGRACLRWEPNHDVYVFRDGDGGVVTTRPSVFYNIDEARNVVLVRGADPEGKKKPQVRAVAEAPKAHPLSPESLAWNGVRRYLALVIENQDIKRESKAKEIAKHELDKALRAGIEVEFDCLPIPHLEEEDNTQLRTKDVTVNFRIATLSLPLGTGDMTVGHYAKPRYIDIDADEGGGSHHHGHHHHHHGHRGHGHHGRHHGESHHGHHHYHGEGGEGGPGHHGHHGEAGHGPGGGHHPGGGGHGGPHAPSHGPGGGGHHAGGGGGHAGGGGGPPPGGGGGHGPGGGGGGHHHH